MTVGEWLSTRTPAPPAPLATRLRELVGSRLNERSEATYDVMLRSASSLLQELLAHPSAGRERALDLLAVDALVTYAFEVAAESPASLAERASAAMDSIATLATVPQHG